MARLTQRCSESDLEASRSVVGLHTLIEQLLESNTKLCDRLKHLEDKFDARSILPPDHDTGDGISGLHPHDAASSFQGFGGSLVDAMSVISRRRRIDFKALDASPIQQVSPLRFSFEDELQSSRVYKRTRFFYPTDRETMASTAIRTQAWSVFSGLSLADISVVSAIALPVLPADISNPEHYVFTAANSEQSPYPWSRRNFKLRTGNNTRKLFPRYGPAVTPYATSSGHVYLMGGLMGNSTTVADLWYIELHGSSEFRCVPVKASGGKPSHRVGHSCVVAGNALCVFGGDTRAGGQGSCDELDNNLYIMNRGAHYILHDFCPP